jgi:hypothetical protein
MRERFGHIFSHDATFKNLKDERKGKVIAAVVWDKAFLGSKAKDALFSKRVRIYVQLTLMRFFT